MSNNLLIEKKYSILKARLLNMIEEHAEAFAQVQILYKELQEAKAAIVNLEERLKEKNVQEKEPRTTVVGQSVETCEK